MEGFLADGGDVVELTRRIREDAAVLKVVATLDPVVDAVERLAPAGEDDPAALALARQLAGPGVCAGLAMRIASARDDARRVALAQTCRQLGDEAAGRWPGRWPRPTTAASGATC